MKTFQAYMTPDMTVLNMETEQAILDGSTKWFEKSGEGDFDYGVTTDNEWA